MTAVRLLLALAIFAAAPYARAAAESSLAPATSAFPAGYEALLHKYATAGGVRYAAWQASANDMEALEAVVEFFASSAAPTDPSLSLAWHLNAYNAWILHNILAKFPTKGPLAGEPLFFHGKRIRLAGQKISFDHLEQKLIRPTFKEPRIHFALNCASESCPPLQTHPFTADTLEADLTRLTRAFVNQNPQGVSVDGGKVRVSKLFDWYADDFGGKEAVRGYINRFRDQPLPGSGKLEFMNYSWKLNRVE